MKKYLEIGKITGTRGLKGELRVEPWCDSPDILAGLKKIYVNGKVLNILSARVQKSMVIMAIEGIIILS